MDQFSAPGIYYFQKKKYLPIKGFVGQDLRRPLVTKFVELHTGGRSLRDSQCPEASSSFSHPPIVHALLLEMLPEMEARTGLSLSPTYGYLRVYGAGESLDYHSDRPSCEISASITLGRSSPNPWPLWIENPDDKTDQRSFDLEPGDAVIYRGCEVPHWREKFQPSEEDDWQCQVFLHYVDRFGPHSHLTFDGNDRLFVTPYVLLSSVYPEMKKRFQIEEVGDDNAGP